VMHEGRIRQVCAPQDIYRRPADLFVASFVGEVNLIPIQLKAGDVIGPTGKRLPAAQRRDVDGNATLCVRPEHLRVFTAGVESPTGIPGRIVNMTFVGDATIFDFRSDDGLQLTSKILNQSKETMPNVGDACFASWVANDATVLTA